MSEKSAEPKPAPSMRELVQGEHAERISHFAEYLSAKFSKLPPEEANFEAEKIVGAPKRDDHPFHEGQKDFRDMDRFFATLAKAESLLRGLSPRAREAVGRSFASIDDEQGLAHLGSLLSLRRHQSEAKRL